VVEDDNSIGSILVDILSQETSYHVLLVTDAFQAMRVLRTIRPSLFMTDYLLPQMNGIALYDHLCATNDLKHVPTIVMSAYLPEDEVKKRQLIGINKPFELDELLDTVEKLLED